MADNIGWILGLIVYLYLSICLYVMATKRGEDNAWFAFIPILDLVLLLSIADMPLWWLILCFIPFINFFAAVMIWMSVARAMGKPSWLGLLVLIPGVNFIVIGYIAFSS